MNVQSMIQIDETEIRRFWDVEKRNGDLTEIRLISPEGKIASGYFKNIENLLSELRKYPGYGVYYTINDIKDDCYGRAQCERIIQKPKNTTVDGDIKGRTTVVIDIDPNRCAGTNATDEELSYAKSKANEIYKFLRDNGFYPPIVCQSPNGAHIKLRCRMQNSDERTDLVKRFLQAMDMLFSDEKVSVDISLSNASRILKCCGSMSYKGNEDPRSDRPRRMAHYVKIPDDWYDNINDNTYFEKIADMLPVKETPNYSNNYQSDSKFDVEDFIKRHDIKVAKKVVTDKMTKWVLAECPWGGAAHPAPDSAIFKMADGSLGFCCLHNSHRHLTFKDLRLKYEPDSLPRRDYAEYQHRQRYYDVTPKQFVPVPENERDGAKWLSPKDIEYFDSSEAARIPFGYESLDSKMGGMLLGDVTVLSGSSGAGKTSWLDCVALNVIQRGYKVAMWSGELQRQRFMMWLDIIASGKSYNKKKDGYENMWYCPRQIAEKINAWLDGKLFLYNNNYKNKAQQLIADVTEVIDKEHVSLICLDNLAAMSLTEYPGQKNDQQTQLITDIKDLAKEKNVTIILVCHPRKAPTFLRKEDIAGTADLTNLCDNLLILHRIGKDFKERAKDFIEGPELERLSEYSSMIEVCKNRDLGVVDYNVGMYYEPESRRLKNSKAEHIVYGWQEDAVAVQQTITAPPTQVEQLQSYTTPQPALQPAPAFTPVYEDNGSMPFAPMSADEEVPF